MLEEYGFWRLEDGGENGNLWNFQMLESLSKGDMADGEKIVKKFQTGVVSIFCHGKYFQVI